MARKIKRKHVAVDTELLNAIFNLEKDWKQIQAIGKHSFERTLEIQYAEKVARARYLFLLKEARHRDLSALRI